MRIFTIAWICLVFGVKFSESTKIDVDLINETIRSLLHFGNSGPNDTVSVRRPPHVLSNYMKNLYQIFVDEDANDDGNLVRAIEPSVGKLENQEVLVFDIEGFDRNEAIMRAELHFYLRRHDSFARHRSRQIRAKSKCLNEYCREQSLRQIRSDDEEFKVVWDATRIVFDSYHLDTKQAVFRISREHSKMRPYSEMVRRSTPFLLIYSKVNHTLDINTVLSQAEQTKRKRRDLGREDIRQYYSYTSIALDEDLKPAEKKSKNRVKYSDESVSSEDVWQGFGEETSFEERERKANEEMENDVRVVLLKNKNRCHKQGTLVSLKYFGWDQYIIQPKTIETSFCQGKCTKPLSNKASNHAMLQSIFAVEPICCAPTNLKSLNILYRDEKGRTTLRNYAKMLIGACSCL
ncbi:unnamed protein product [Caenorhabditis angaria]|uniref:TGF-beta family profile domain-containing protein n=1 Tax=Caenorhabditis angaria TaxID=860376 RepID=A0A9P1IPD0_9PELO|nr:unnamed protein product [Caenorhabditis angaria]